MQSRPKRTCNFLFNSTAGPEGCAAGGVVPLADGLSVFLLAAAGLGRSDRTKVRVWKREKVANGTRESGICFCSRKVEGVNGELVFGDYRTRAYSHLLRLSWCRPTKGKSE